jgi:hypothetical protein
MSKSVRHGTLLENQNFSKDVLSYSESKHHKPWFDEECSKLVVQRKQAKLQWLQDTGNVNEDE